MIIHLLRCNKRISFACYQISRALHKEAKSLWKDYSEVEIKVPWGTVAGKWWGTQDKQPILALHGWQDNAGSFDALAPLLVKDNPILAIDLPGHGLSSWLPPGTMYFEIVYILLLQRIRRHFKWKNIKLLSHSLGAQVSFWYASLYPQEVEFVIALDHLKFPSVPMDVYSKIITKSIDKFLNIETFEMPPPSYLEDDIMKKWIEATEFSLDENACRILMNRGANKTSDGKVVLTRDPKLKVLPIHTGFTHNQLQELAKSIICPYLMLRAKDSRYFEDIKYFEDIAAIMKNNCKELQMKEVPGRHHFHLTNAPAVADAIVPFLEKYN